jgi:hypothetical protein
MTMIAPSSMLLRAAARQQRLFVHQQRPLSTAATKPGKPAMKKKKSDIEPSNMQLFVHAGLPMIGFSMLAAWVLKNSIEGKNKEFETSRGQASK